MQNFFYVVNTTKLTATKLTAEELLGRSVSNVDNLDEAIAEAIQAIESHPDDIVLVFDDKQDAIESASNAMEEDDAPIEQLQALIEQIEVM